MTEHAAVINYNEYDNPEEIIQVQWELTALNMNIDDDLSTNCTALTDTTNNLNNLFQWLQSASSQQGNLLLVLFNHSWSLKKVNKVDT